MESIIILFLAFILDAFLGDPFWLPHLIVGYGKLISFWESLLNTGRYKVLKGALLTLFTVGITYWVGWLTLYAVEHCGIQFFKILVGSVLMFYCLANRTLIKEGRSVFSELEKGLDQGRSRLSWIVGRETKNLSTQQVRIATFETMSENLSDGVIAPLFYFALLGVPGAMAYKMINTLDSMIGYRNERYEQFGKFAARLDDVANIIPSRLTALLILIVSGKQNGLIHVFKEGKKHKSPNAGYPEAALAYVLDCRFGGPNSYHGKLVEKPYIGSNDRLIKENEIDRVCIINFLSATVCVIIIAIVLWMI